jgi:hypothetical protein
LPQWLDMRDVHPMRRGGPPRRDAASGEVTKRGFCNPKTPLKIGERWFKGSDQFAGCIRGTPISG